MRLVRHYFISDDLNDLERLETQLEKAGISTEQIHVLSMDDAEVDKHRQLHPVQPLMKMDIVHSGMIGLGVGVFASALVFVLANAMGWTETAAGYIPFVFLSIVLLGFCTWEGGLLGVHRMNYKFARFRKALARGKHVFFVDLEPEQKRAVRSIIKAHTNLRPAGTGESTPGWILTIHRSLSRVLRTWP